MALWAAFTLGLLGSLHCVGMCGPIALALPLTASEKWKVVLQSLLYQFGRVTTYGFMGLFMGIMGWGILLSGYQKVISIILGISLILAAIFSFSMERNLMRSTFIQKQFAKLKTKLGQLLAIKSTSHAYKIGLLNGFLPCGLVYIALAGAVVTGDVLQGGLYMVVFGLGTIPLMMGVMLFGKFGRRYFQNLRKLIPYALVIFGVYLVFRGMNLEVPSNFDLLQSGKSMKMCH